MFTKFSIEWECHKILHEVSNRFTNSRVIQSSSAASSKQQEKSRNCFVLMPLNTTIVVSPSHQYPESPFSSLPQTPGNLFSHPADEKLNHKYLLLLYHYQNKFQVIYSKV